MGNLSDLSESRPLWRSYMGTAGSDTPELRWLGPEFVRRRQQQQQQKSGQRLQVNKWQSNEMEGSRSKFGWVAKLIDSGSTPGPSFRLAGVRQGTTSKQPTFFVPLNHDWIRLGITIRPHCTAETQAMHSPASDVPGQKPFWMSTSSSSGPLASFDRSAGSIRFVSGEVLVLLRPTESFHHHGSIEEAPWPVVRGAVELDLPKAKRIELLEVERASGIPFS